MSPRRRVSEMMVPIRQRAFVRNEGTGRGSAPWFVYTESETGSAPTFAARFKKQATADQIAKALNRAYEAEDRLWVTVPEPLPTDFESRRWGF